MPKKAFITIEEIAAAVEYLDQPAGAERHRPDDRHRRRMDGAMSFVIVLAALVFLMVVAYRGYSVILFAPVAALGAVLLTDPSLVAPVFTGLFMDKMVGFLKLYFPVFLLGAVFGKVIELSGFSKSIVVGGHPRASGASGRSCRSSLVCALLTYGGVSLFVVVFAVYPFAAELFRQGDIPKRLIPGTIALGRLHLHDGCAARHAADPEHHPDHVLRHHHLGRAVARHGRRGCSSSSRA